MIGMIAGWLVSAKVPQRVARPIAAVLLCIVAAALLYFGGSAIIRSIGDEAVRDHEAEIQLDVERSGRRADQNIVTREAARRDEETAARKEFNNATIGLPNEGLSCRQRIDICGELRDAGRDTSLISECNDICAGKEAGSEPPNPAR